MSHAIVFLPGIMGTSLTLDGKEVWPPKPRETVFGYKRIDALQSDDVQVGEIINSVSCFGFYNTILKYFVELGYTEGGAERRFVPVPYDWRLDLFELADQLASKLDHVEQDNISIVAHSMGGLISRLLLESGKYRDREWFERVDMLATLSTPHTGAPLALARTLGLDSAVGISAKDFKTLSANPKYPSGYQLLPAPGEHAAWDADEDGTIEPLDIYDEATAQSLGLEFNLVERAKAVHDCFEQGTAPDHIRYFYFAGTGHKTLTRINVVRGGPGQPDVMTKVMARASGDGTVPLWSSLPRPTQKHLVVQEHATVFRGNPFKNVFFQLFGVHIGSLELEMLGDDVEYSIGQPVYSPDDPDNEIEVVLTGPSGIATLEGQIVVEEIGENQLATGKGRREFPINYNGPPLRILTLDVSLPKAPGFYRLILRDLSDGAPRDVGDGIVFSVTGSDSDEREN